MGKHVVGKMKQIQVGERFDMDKLFKVALSEEERGSCSTFHELRGIEEGLGANVDKLRGKIVQ